MTSKDDHTVTRALNSCVYVMVAIFSSEELTIPKATVLGVAEEISELLVDKFNVGNEDRV